jgi:hypothetical protein
MMVKLDNFTPGLELSEWIAQELYGLSARLSIWKSIVDMMARNQWGAIINNQDLYENLHNHAEETSRYLKEFAMILDRSALVKFDAEKSLKETMQQIEEINKSRE